MILSMLTHTLFPSLLNVKRISFSCGFKRFNGDNQVICIHVFPEKRCAKLLGEGFQYRDEQYGSRLDHLLKSDVWHQAIHWKAFCEGVMVPMGLYILEDSNRTPCLRGIHRTPSGMLALPCRPGTTVIVDRFLDLDMQVSMFHLVGEAD